MKLTRKLIAAMLSVCMVLALLTSAAASANINANYGAASYYDIAVSTYSRMLAFQNGGVVPAANQSKQYGLIDPTGKVILPFQYADVWALDGGLFAVAREADDYGNYTGLGVVNAKGKVLLAPSDDCVDIGSRNGIVRVTTRTVTVVESDWGSFPSFDYDTKYYTTDWQLSTEEAYNSGYSDPWGSGNWEDTRPAALREYDYYEEVGGCYRVTKYDDDWNQLVGVLDSQYKVIVPLGQYRYVGTPNADGYISVAKLDGSTDLYKDGRVAKTFANKMVSTEVYFRYLTFSTTGEKHGMMDINENVLLPEQYDVIDTDGNNYIRASKSKGEDSWEYVHGLYTQDCKQVFADTYSEITYLADGKYRLNNGTHFGVSKVDGAAVTPVIPMKYQDMRVYTLQFIELYDGSKYSVVDLSNNVVVPESTQEINAFKGDAGGLGETLDRVSWYAEAYDGYTETVLPFLSKTGSGWTTVYADYMTGEVEGQLGVRASNINDEGWFVYQNANGLYGFGRVEGAGFLDIIPGHWAEKAVDWAVNGGKEITNGVGNGKFNPDAQCTNAMILTFLWRAAGKPVSTAQLPVDITGKKVDYAESALRWAAEKGMISKDFDPNAACTSASAVKFIWQAFDSPAPKGGSTFTDVPANADYAAAVAWAEQLGITQGEGSHIFSPDKVCSRGRILTFLYRAYVEDARLK